MVHHSGASMARRTRGGEKLGAISDAHAHAHRVMRMKSRKKKNKNGISVISMKQ